MSAADSTLLISDFEPQHASAEVGTEDEFDPIPVTGRKNSQGESPSCLLVDRRVRVITGWALAPSESLKLKG